jgi:ribosomal protein S18 acetylase RimI-like enzyme
MAALHVEDLDGWSLRYDESAAWWVSSVMPHRVGTTGDLPARIGLVEEFYRRHGQPARFQISPAVQPVDLDDLLAGRGYRRESPMSLQTAATEAVIQRLPAAGPQVHVDDHPTEDWFQVWYATHGAGGDPVPERRMLYRVGSPVGYGYAMSGGAVVAVGRAVADTGWAGVFGMATLPAARGRGAGRSVLAALARWAADHRAAHLYLQVENGNTAARGLYGGAGFGELCRYHYRTAPPDAAG